VAAALARASMDGMATLRVQNVPEHTYRRLQALAKEHDQSLNAEVLDILEVASQRPRGTAITHRLEEIARRINLPPDAPKAEDLIRKGRAERDRRF
jgi:plasmid stability protein